MAEFLEFIDSPKQFHIIRKMNISETFKECITILNKNKDEDKQAKIKLIFFTNLLMCSTDATKYMRKIKKPLMSMEF
ncbi:hypothetical protein [Chakrabartyella piscis]|uniref:hypothetical protein n=1 Tax=Chakrabartyella piscis TaxID=2918914 RepID=UPI002958B16B|nr:hypothetical protein [Chakrabartyella piscis]